MDRRRWWLLVGGGTLAIMGICTGVQSLMSASAEREFQAELALARQEGLPTTPAEFAALVPVAEPDENAAKFYCQVKISFPTEAYGWVNQLIHAPTPTLVADAENLIASNQEALRLVEQGTQLPKCSFERDWERSAELEMSEYAELSRAATLLRLRATLSMRRGDHAQATADAERMLRLAKHIQLEPTSYAQRVAHNLWERTVMCLAGWADVARGKHDYFPTLTAAIDDWPEPDVRRVASNFLIDTLDQTKLVQTAEGRARLGFVTEDYTLKNAIMSRFGPRNARAMLVAGYRDVWRALKLPPGKRNTALTSGDSKLAHASSAFPPLLIPRDLVYFLDTYEPRILAVQMQFQALARVLKKGETADTSDLISPVSGKPIRVWKEDGRLRTDGGPSSSMLAYPPFYPPPSPKGPKAVPRPSP